MVGRTVAQYMFAGVAALHLEDQVVNKRCGHLMNKELVPEDVYLARIRAAANMRQQTAGDIVIIARTDALQSLGYDAAVSRLKQAIAIGADVVFLEGITSKEEGRRACQELAPTPCLLNMAHGGVTPHLSVGEARELGYRIMIFPGLALAPVYEAVTNAVTELKERGDVTVRKDGIRLREVFEVCGLEEAIKFDIDAGGNMYSKGA